MVQYKAALMITGEIKGISRETLSSSFIPLHEATQGILTSYLQTYCNIVGEGACLTSLTTQDKIKPIPARSKVTENLFLLYCINFI